MSVSHTIATVLSDTFHDKAVDAAEAFREAMRRYILAPTPASLRDVDETRDARDVAESAYFIAFRDAHPERKAFTETV